MLNDFSGADKVYITPAATSVSGGELMVWPAWFSSSSSWLLTATEDWLQPIYNVLHQQLCKEKVLHGDETTLQVPHEKGKSATNRSYM